MRIFLLFFLTCSLIAIAVVATSAASSLPHKDRKVVDILSDQAQGSGTGWSLSHFMPKSSDSITPSTPLATTPTSAAVNAIATGFTWAENLIFNCDEQQASLWVTDCIRGQLFKITSSTEVDASSKLSSYVQTPWIATSEISKLLGLAITPDYQHLYVAGMTSDKKYHLFEVNQLVPNNYTILVTLPKLPNGLAYDDLNSMLYTCSEGFFLPNSGECFFYSLKYNQFGSIINDLYALDGVWLDEVNQLLYISDVFHAHIYVLNITNVHTMFTSPTQSIPLSSFPIFRDYAAPNCTMVDDFTLTPTNDYLYVSDFWKGNIVSFPANNEGPSRIIATGFKQPTSARFGCDNNAGSFWNTSLYVTEGGGLFSWQKDRSVWEIPNVL